MTKLYSAAAAALMLIITGCSSTDTANTSTDTTNELLPSAQDFFTAMVDQDPARMKELAAPNSPAEQFTEYWNDALSTGVIKDRTATFTDSSVTVTREEKETADVSTTYTDFDYDNDERLITWTEQPGGPLPPRINTTTKTAKAKPVKLTILNQYATSESYLWINATIENTTTDTVKVTAFDFVTPEGKKRAAFLGDGKSGGSITLTDNTPTPIFVEVGKVKKPGGTLIVKTTTPDGYPIATTNIKLPS